MISLLRSALRLAWYPATRVRRNYDRGLFCCGSAFGYASNGKCRLVEGFVSCPSFPRPRVPGKEEQPMNRRALLTVLIVCASFFVTVGAAVAAPQYVIEITVDGLGSPYLQSLVAAGQLPNFQRLETEGAWTLNARCDYDFQLYELQCRRRVGGF
jgi:hypothetical protein